MQSAPSDAYLDFLRARTDIVRLIGEYIELQAEGDGRIHKGSCPFHVDQENTFTVDSHRQSYKCRVCNEGGDCFSFLMTHNQCSFAKALDVLVRRISSPD